jgi:hypothetical protein
MGSLSGGPDMITGRRVPTAYIRTAESIPIDRFRRYMNCNSLEELLNSYTAMAQLKGTTTEIEFNIAYGNWRGEQE